ncbi:MAG TPA: glycosyltransferase [Gaiellaceae bacterium]|nr:glycosyltransferase [Gaiellaceae bacterium]
MLTVTIIIPLHRRTRAFERCVEAAVAVSHGRHEVLVVADKDPGVLPESVRLVLTNSPTDTSPAEKRDIALAEASGEVCAFLDDDAFPRDDWLESALLLFELDADGRVAGVGGPGVTPPGSGWRERAGGAFYESPFGSGGVRFRFRPEGSVRDVDDLPAFNLFMRTDALRAIGGWASKLYGGEDTMVCLRLVEAGYRLLYDPEVVVYHHRRPVFGPHLRQVGNVGRHRGHFARVLPQTSRRPLYFAPTAGLLIGALGLVAITTNRRLRLPGAAAAVSGWAVIATQARKDGCEPTIAAALPAVVVASHASYGVQFLRGFFTRSIEEM